MVVPPTEGQALAATFGTLGFFLLATLALGRTRLFKTDADSYVSARNTQGSFSLTMSFFASGAGAWVLYTVPEAAVLGGPVAVIGYALSCVVPLLIFAWSAPALRRNLPYGITYYEYIQARFGTAVNVYATLISAFYMFLYLAAEFSSVGGAVSLFSGGASGLSAIVGTSLVTLVYTSLGGLPVSLITDKVQGVGLVIFTILITIGVLGFCLFPEYTDVESSATASANWKMATSWGINGNAGDSFSMAIILISAVTSANLMHSGFQQRIWAARDNAAVRNGLYGASTLTIPFILLFGLFGMVAFAQFGFGGLVAPDYLAFLAGFFIIGMLPTGWQILAIILAVMMVASSADTIQTGLSGLFTPPIERMLCCKGPRVGRVTRKTLAFGLNLALTVSLNVLAIVLATQNISVLSLFVLADLLCATCCVPILMGLSDKIHPAAALSGCLTGLVCLLIIYGVGLPGAGEEGNFVKVLEPGGLYAKTSLVAFIVTPLASGLVTLLVAIPFRLQRDRCLHPNRKG
jgi:Na+/proline symporter